MKNHALNPLIPYSHSYKSLSSVPTKKSNLTSLPSEAPTTVNCGFTEMTCFRVPVIKLRRKNPDACVGDESRFFI